MNWSRSQITRILRKVLLFIVITAITTSLAYFGVKWWLKYANTEAFKGEVNAAIITGIVTVITLVVTTWFNWYTTYRSQRAILREELFRKRLEVYQDVIRKVREMWKLAHQFFLYSPDPTIPPRVVELGKIIEDIVWHNSYLFSGKTSQRLDEIRVVGLIFELIQDSLYLDLPYFITKEQYCTYDSIYRPPEGIVTAEEYYWNGLIKIFAVAHRQLLRDLGVDTIRIELDEFL